MSSRSKPRAGRRDRQAADGELQEFLTAIGVRVREARVTRGMTRRVLAADSGVSERYLAQLETGQGNPSIAVLRDVADAMGCSLQGLVGDGEEDGRTRISSKLRDLGADSLRQVEIYLEDTFPAAAIDGRGQRIALVGLRGAGKTTLGLRLAEQLGFPFIELNRLVEQEYGASIGELLSLSGQPAFQRLERRCLEVVAKEYDQAVIATGGGIVADPGTFSMLLAQTHCIWVRARADEHMKRVLAQGDLRPMADNKEAMDDLEQILTVREPAYRQAKAVIDTAGQAVEESTEDLHAAAYRLLGLS